MSSWKVCSYEHSGLRYRGRFLNCSEPFINVMSVQGKEWSISAGGRDVVFSSHL